MENLFLDDQIFVGLDMIDTTRRLLDEKEFEICKGMTELELKAYHYGLDTFTSMIEALLTPEGDEIFVHIPRQDGLEEFVYEDLIKKLE